MNFNKISVFAITSLCFFLLSCNPKMEIPSYIWIENIDFQVANEAEQGTASHKITGVWITANGKNLGMYPLPTRIPILENGKTRIVIDAGIMVGGVSLKRVAYPFYASYDTTLNLKKGEIDTLRPIFTYMQNLTFKLMENFENAGNTFTAYGTSAPLDRTDNPDLIFRQTNESNNYSGIIDLPHTNDTATVYHFEIRTISPVDLTFRNSDYCLMELNFCITDNIEIGMIAHSASSSFINKQIPLANLSGVDRTKNEKPVWKKAYINFSQGIGEEGASMQMKDFDIYIRSTVTSSTKDARFLFDNIKLIHN